MRPERLDRSGIDYMPTSSMGNEQREIERAEQRRLRGIMPSCQACRRECKVLRGSPGTKAKFICLMREKP